MNPRSDALFHFTKQAETLYKILKSGFWPRYCLEDVSWLGFEKFDYIGYPMVCFCDIPLSRINSHRAFYGDFGVGMSKEWGIKNGLNPIAYISGNNAVSKTYKDLNEYAHKFPEGVNRENSKVAMRFLVANAKPIQGTMFVGNEPKDKVFYHESEWRFVPVSDQIEEYLTLEESRDPQVLEAANEGTKNHCMIKFEPEDIKYIFVESDGDIPSLVNFINAELGHLQANQQKILYSRIISLESLNKDI